MHFLADMVQRFIMNHTNFQTHNMANTIYMIHTDDIVIPFTRFIRFIRFILFRVLGKLYVELSQDYHSKKDPATAGSNQSVPSIGVTIQKCQKLFAEHSTSMDTAELKGI